MTPAGTLMPLRCAGAGGEIELGAAAGAWGGVCCRVCQTCLCNGGCSCGIGCCAASCGDAPSGAVCPRGTDGERLADAEARPWPTNSTSTCTRCTDACRTEGAGPRATAPLNGAGGVGAWPGGVWQRGSASRRCRCLAGASGLNDCARDHSEGGCEGAAAVAACGPGGEPSRALAADTATDAAR